MNTPKGATRIGMGICQGRNCLGTLAALLARERGCGPADLVYPRPVRRPAPRGSATS